MNPLRTIDGIIFKMWSGSLPGRAGRCEAGTGRAASGVEAPQSRQNSQVRLLPLALSAAPYATNGSATLRESVSMG